jgi:hypothetical protein
MRLPEYEIEAYDWFRFSLMYKENPEKEITLFEIIAYQSRSNIHQYGVFEPDTYEQFISSLANLKLMNLIVEENKKLYLFKGWKVVYSNFSPNKLIDTPEYAAYQKINMLIEEYHEKHRLKSIL